VLSMMLVAVAGNAQSLEEIISKNNVATGNDKLANVTTIYVEAKANQMGTEMPMVMYMKQPGKVKVVITYNGMEIITAFDGEKGWMINPMTGSFDAVEIPEEQIKGITKNDMFKSEFQEYGKNKKLQLAGEEDVDGKPAYKLMATSDTDKPVYFFVDKASFLLTKTSKTVTQMGQEMVVDEIIKEYSDIDGVKFPKTIITYINGSTEAGSVVFDKIELNKPIEDSVFKIN
jgi:hypothetical protein